MKHLSATQPCPPNSTPGANCISSFWFAQRFNVTKKVPETLQQTLHKDRRDKNPCV